MQIAFTFQISFIYYFYQKPIAICFHFFFFIKYVKITMIQIVLINMVIVIYAFNGIFMLYPFFEQFSMHKFN